MRSGVSVSGQLPCPRNEHGFLDEKKIFQIVVGSLKLPISYLDELTPMEIGWLLEQDIEDKMQHYELISSCVQFGYVNAKSKKQKKMFKKREEDLIKKITQEQREKEKEYIESLFKEGESV